ncbi:ATP synthase gamma chain [Dirofilaria immitis]
MATIALKNDYIEQSKSSKSKNKQNKKPFNRSLLKFAVEKAQQNVARVKLLLCNNSNRQVEWILKCTDTAIKAEPKTSGHIDALGTDEVNFMWQRPEHVKVWADAPSPKIQLFIKLITVETGQEIVDTFAKFKAVINPKAECTINDLPIHKMTLKSEAISEQLTNDENDFKNDFEIEAAYSRDFLKDPDTLFWLIVVVCCFLGAVILQSVDDDFRKSRRHDYD